MQRTSSPWAQALITKKEPLDLHPDVLRAVLAINPAMRRGRTTGQVTTELQQLACEARPASGRSYSEGKFRNVFGMMLGELDQQLKDESAKFAERRAQLVREEAAKRAELANRIVAFLVEVAPGPLSETSRTVLRDHADLLRRLGIEPAQISRLVREQADAVSFPS